MNSLLAAVIGLSCVFLTQGAPFEDEVTEPHFYGFGGDDTYIVGGEDVKLGELPYQITLRHGDNHLCGGSIINKEWVVSAAHCVPGSGGGRGMKIWAGTVNEEDVGSGTIVEVERIVSHPDYKHVPHPYFIANDIALLKLKVPLAFGPNIQPVALPSPNHIPTGNALVSGWGRTKVSPKTPILQKVFLKTLDDNECGEIYKSLNITIPPHQLCGGDTEGKKAQCQGDSGGPWVIPGTRTLIGVVSWGVRECTSKTYPGVAMEVSHYIDWIKKTTA